MYNSRKYLERQKKILYKNKEKTAALVIPLLGKKKNRRKKNIYSISFIFHFYFFNPFKYGIIILL